MLRWHRAVAAFGSLLVLWIVLTGTGIQIADMRALLAHAPASDPDMQKMAQWHTGPTNFVVRQWPDFDAQPIPPGTDVIAELGKAAALGRAAAPGDPMKNLELRMAGGTLAGFVEMGRQRLIFDLSSGRRLPDRFLPLKPLKSDFKSPREFFKKLHRFAYIGPWAILFNFAAGVTLSVLCVTGYLHFYRLWRLRRNKGKASLFWKSPSRWRMLHRWISVVASVLVLWLVTTGMVLSWNNVGQLILIQLKTGTTEKKSEVADYSSPLQDVEIPAMARISLDAFNRDHPGTGFKTFRLRHFAGYAQAVIIAADKTTSQLVYNAKTGAAMSESEPGYPDTFYPLGWEGNQVLKRLHRGDAVGGLFGRWMIVLAALALCYQSISGVVIYVMSWQARRKA